MTAPPIVSPDWPKAVAPPAKAVETGFADVELEEPVEMAPLVEIALEVPVETAPLVETALEVPVETAPLVEMALEVPVETAPLAEMVADPASALTVTPAALHML